MTKGRTKFIRVKDVAGMLDVRQGHIYKLVKQGAIPYYRFKGAIRFDLKEIELWVESQKFDPMKASQGHSR